VQKLAENGPDPSQREELAENIVEKVRDVKYSGHVPHGLYPMSLNPHTGDGRRARFPLAPEGTLGTSTC
jgi:hypothetical protein